MEQRPPRCQRVPPPLCCLGWGNTTQRSSDGKTLPLKLKSDWKRSEPDLTPFESIWAFCWLQSETDQGFIACLPSSEMLCDKQDTGIISVMKCLLFYHSSDYAKKICIMLRVSSGLSKDEMVWFYGLCILFGFCGVFYNWLDLTVPWLMQTSQLAGTKTI